MGEQRFLENKREICEVQTNNVLYMDAKKDEWSRWMDEQYSQMVETDVLDGWIDGWSDYLME